MAKKQIPVVRADSLAKCLNILAVEEKRYHFNKFKAWDILEYLADVVKQNAFLIEIDDNQDCNQS